jgi:hypothetical protein
MCAGLFWGDAWRPHAKEFAMGGRDGSTKVLPKLHCLPNQQKMAAADICYPNLDSLPAGPYENMFRPLVRLAVEQKKDKVCGGGCATDQRLHTLCPFCSCPQQPHICVLLASRPLLLWACPCNTSAACTTITTM